MHMHYAAIVTGHTADEATRATTALMESYGPDSARPLCASYGVGGRWDNTLQQATDAPEGDYSTLADYHSPSGQDRPCGANLIRARSLSSPGYSLTEALADEERARAVAVATRGLDVPPFPGLYSDPGFADDFVATRESAWMRAARQVWEATADGADNYLSWETAPFLIQPDLYTRFRDSFAHKNALYGFIIETPTVFTHPPEGLQFSDDATAVYIPGFHVRRPSESLDTQEQMIRSLEPETTWLVSLDLHS